MIGPVGVMAEEGQGVRPSVFAPKTLDGKPQDLQNWLFGLELYFAACRLDYTGADSEYCCKVTASLFHGNACCRRVLGCHPHQSCTGKALSFGVV